MDLFILSICNNSGYLPFSLGSYAVEATVSFAYFNLLEYGLTR